MAVAKTQDPEDPNFNPDDLLNQDEGQPSQEEQPLQFGYTNPDQTSPPVYQTASAPTTSESPEPAPTSPSALPPSDYTVQAPAPSTPQSGQVYTPPSGNTGINGGAIGAGTQVQPAGSYQYMEGVDTNKLNDPSVTSPKYVASRILASGGTVAQAAAAVGGTVIDATRFKLPTGEIIDTRRDEEGANALQWLVTGGGPEAGAAGATGTASGGIGSQIGPYASTLAGITGGAQGDAITAAIMRLLGRGEAPVDANDPNIAGPTAAFRAQADTATRRARNALAERDAFLGLNSGGSGSGSFDSAIQSQMEQEGRDVGSYQGNLMVQEIQARRQDVVQALQFAQGEQKLQLESELAQMDDQLKRLGLSQQNNQFYDQFAYNMGKDQQDYNAMLTRYLLQ
jgi:hypothetical protein